VLQRLLSHSRADVAVSVITEASPDRRCQERGATKTLRLVENFLRLLTIVDFASSDAEAYASVRAKLERAGTPIGPLDTLIAAQAIARAVLVSNNEREFGRVAGLPSTTGLPEATENTRHRGRREFARLSRSGSVPGEQRGRELR
jgi:tRNA(fMet)-specific endonuclease VapC